MAKRDEVDEVVGVEVGDERGKEALRWHLGGDVREGALPQVQQQRRGPVRRSNEVGRAEGAGLVAVRGAGTRDQQLE